MTKRLDGRVAVVVGGGQTPGETIGNGRATSVLFAREGARILVVDRDLTSARATVAIIESEGGEALAHAADITDPDSCATIVDAALERFGALDVLHNNVGTGTGDLPATKVDEEVWQRIFDINLTGMWRTCKAAIPVMREQGRGSIVNISSVASIRPTATAAYRISKAGVNSLTEHLAITNARHGIRVNAVLPGKMNTPMAIEGITAASGISREEVIAQRDASVPLRRQMGTGWDVAHAALFLASDESQFITGALLAVDGGQHLLRA
jgi:NAD(P)-dependent dehydrogenase (short-subunit alcohol dehydrogenase family)